MPRDSAGNYSLVAGNPVQSGEVVSSSWANNTLDDVAVALSDSLDRNGRGGMLAPFRFSDGTNLLPGAAWVNETTTGFYRFDGGDLRLAVLTQDVMRWQTSGVQIWNNTDLIWQNVLTDGGGGAQVPVNVGTADGQTLRWEADNSVWEASSALIVDDAGNVGIGTAAPFATLDIVAPAGQVDYDIQAWGTPAFAGGMKLRVSDTDAASPLWSWVVNSNEQLAFTMGATEAMRIDSAGNVGIGTNEPLGRLHSEPAAAFNPAAANPVNNAAIVAGSGGAAGTGAVGGSLVFSRADGLLNGSCAINAYQADANTAKLGLDFWVHPTFNGADPMERAMRIDSSGNVGIGTDAPTTALEVHASSGSPAIIARRPANNTSIAVWSSNDEEAGRLLSQNSNLRLRAQAGYGLHYMTQGSDEHIWWQNGASTLDERMRIDAAGNVGIGTGSNIFANLHVQSPSANPGQAMLVQGTGGATGDECRIHMSTAGSGRTCFIGAEHTGGTSSHALIFGSNASGADGIEHMRIDANGNLLVGGTTGTYRLSVMDGANTRMGVRSDGAVFTPDLFASAPTADDVFLTATGFLNIPTSSIRFKDNVRDYTKGLAEVLAMRPVWYNSTTEDADPDEDHVGFIAEEFAALGLEELVGRDRDGEVSTVAYKLIGPLLVKAIQELTARVEELEGA